MRDSEDQEPLDGEVPTAPLRASWAPAPGTSDHDRHLATLERAGVTEQDLALSEIALAAVEDAKRARTDIARLVELALALPSRELTERLIREAARKRPCVEARRNARRGKDELIGWARSRIRRADVLSPRALSKTVTALLKRHRPADLQARFTGGHVSADDVRRALGKKA